LNEQMKHCLSNNLHAKRHCKRVQFSYRGVWDILVLKNSESTLHFVKRKISSCPARLSLKVVPCTVLLPIPQESSTGRFETHPICDEEQKFVKETDYAIDGNAGISPGTPTATARGKSSTRSPLTSSTNFMYHLRERMLGFPNCQRIFINCFLFSHQIFRSSFSKGP